MASINSLENARRCLLEHEDEQAIHVAKSRAFVNTSPPRLTPSVPQKRKTRSANKQGKKSKSVQSDLDGPVDIIADQPGDVVNHLVQSRSQPSPWRQTPCSGSAFMPVRHLSPAQPKSQYPSHPTPQTFNTPTDIEIVRAENESLKKQLRDAVLATPTIRHMPVLSQLAVQRSIPGHISSHHVLEMFRQQDRLNSELELMHQARVTREALNESHRYALMQSFFGNK
jgi:hypothetical protein